MKKPLIVVIAMIVLVCSHAYARDVSLGLGGAIWHVWWQPYWEKNSHFTKSWCGFPRNGLLSRTNDTNRVTPSLLYGPAVTLSLPKHFRISTLFMYGEFSGEGSGDGIVLMYNWMYSKTSMKIRRYESDSMISYSLTGFFHLFLGFKYMNHDYLIRGILPWGYSSALYLAVDRIRKKYNEYAPGVGFGFTVPLVKGSLYLLINGSVIYNFTHFNTYVKSIFFVSSMTLPFPITSSDGGLSKLGCSASAAFAYYIHPMRTTITTGFRYQMFKLLENDPTESIRRQQRLWEHFYGITASVMVKIDFSGRDRDNNSNTL